MACAGVLMQSDGPALPPLDYEFDGFAAVDADYDAARPPFDETRSPHLSRGLNLGRHIFYFSAIIRLNSGRRPRSWPIRNIRHGASAGRWRRK